MKDNSEKKIIISVEIPKREAKMRSVWRKIDAICVD